MKKVEKVWGSELWVANHEKYCGKILTIKKGFQCSIHHHRVKEESFYVLGGQILMEINDTHKNDCFIMEEGDAVDIHTNLNHRFSAIKDSKIIEFSTHHDDEDSYRKTKSREWLMV